MEEEGWRRRPLQPPGQTLGVEPRTCAWCSGSTSAPAETAGAWLRQASEPTTLAEVYIRLHADIMHTNLSIPREWCTQQSARAPPLKYVSGVYRMRYVMIIIIPQRAKRRLDCVPAGAAPGGARARARGARRAVSHSRSREFSEKACREPGPSLLNKLP